MDDEETGLGRKRPKERGEGVPLLSSRTQISACLSVSGALKLNARKKKNQYRIRASRLSVNLRPSVNDGCVRSPDAPAARRLLLSAAPARVRSS